MVKIRTQKMHPRNALRRRCFLRAAAAGTATLAVPGAGSAVAAAQIPHPREFNPFASAKHYEAVTKPFYGDRNIMKRVADWQIKSYQETPEAQAGEAACITLYNYWRLIEPPQERARIAQAGARFARQVARDFPRAPGGLIWVGSFEGLVMLTRGILDNLKMIPSIETPLNQAVELDPTHYFHLARLSLAKLYMKAPPFPMSIGRMETARKLLDASEKVRTAFPIWALFEAEWQLQVNGKDAALAALDLIEEVDPPLEGAAHTAEIAKFDAALFRQAIAGGNYDKYHGALRAPCLIGDTRSPSDIHNDPLGQPAPKLNKELLHVEWFWHNARGRLLPICFSGQQRPFRRE